MGHKEEKDALSQPLPLEKKRSQTEHTHNKVNITKTALPKHMQNTPWEKDKKWKSMKCVLSL